MSETPFMPLWVADFIRDTLDLDAKEVGAYLLILMTMWGRDGYLPNDEKKLQRVARCGRDWPRVWSALSHYFTVDGDRITQSRLLKELQKVAAKRIVNAQHGARGGRAKALKNKQPDLANASGSLQQPEPEPYRDGGGGTREPVSTDREAILTAIGVDPVSGITGPSARQIGTRADMAEAGRWLDLPGMTMPLVIEEVRRVMANKRDGPPSSFKFFTKAMQRLSGELTQEALQPTQPATGARHDRQRFDKTIDALAAGLSSGAIGLGLESRDPFAKRPRGDAQEGEYGPGPVLRSGQ